MAKDSTREIEEELPAFPSSAHHGLQLTQEVKGLKQHLAMKTKTSLQQYFCLSTGHIMKQVCPQGSMGEDGGITPELQTHLCPASIAKNNHM